MRNAETPAEPLVSQRVSSTLLSNRPDFIFLPRRDQRLGTSIGAACEGLHTPGTL